MRLPSGSTVRGKLILASILSMGAALLVAGTVITGYDLVTMRQRLAGRLSIQTDMVGANCLSALLFNDPASAETTLASLKADPRVRAAGLYAVDSRPFATYVRDPASAGILPSRSPDGIGPEFRGRDDQVHLSRNVLFEGRPIGRVVIVSDLSEINATIARDVAMFSGILSVSLLIALALSIRLQRAISGPILSLAGTARKVSLDRDYSVRASGSSGDEIGALIVAFNEMLEEIQQQEAELRSASDRLEQRVAERTAQLETANKELEAFSYSVSHDLRAPLRSIEGFSRALMEDCADRLDEGGTDSLKRIVASTVRMGQLIDGLLNLSRVTRAEIRRRSVDLSSLAGEILDELRQGEEGRRVESVIARGAMVKGDAALLRAVLQNLLGNAWKFTRNRADARIEFGVATDSGETRYFVQDNGAGFDMAYSDKLFGAFQRLHGQNEFPGIGIGLATVQRIVGRHGGRAWATGAPDQGATVYFTLGEGGRNGGKANRVAGGRQPGRRGPDSEGAEEEQHPQ